MPKKSKRFRAIEEMIDSDTFSIDSGLELIKKLPKVKFPETVEIAINLGIDPKKSDQIVRGATVLPNGTGRVIRVAVLAQGDNADNATKAGADIVGFEDLAESINGGNLDFDVLIATPDAMRIVGQLGKFLGPRGLMPNPKDGTVTNDVAKAVENAKKGQVRFRAEKNGIIHCVIGKIDFTVQMLKENLNVLLASLKKAKPSSAKGIYFKKITLTSTMGPGILIDKSSLDI